MHITLMCFSYEVWKECCSFLAPDLYCQISMVSICSHSREAMIDKIQHVYHHKSGESVLDYCLSIIGAISLSSLSLEGVAAYASCYVHLSSSCCER
jgi:hypothetical protein